MTQEDKQLLLKDLSARLPYGVMCDRLGHSLKLVGVHPNKEFALEFDRGEYMPTEYTVDDVKPHLRPMSSMTDEEKDYVIHLAELPCAAQICEKKVDFFLSHHVDWRGLIEKGLAIEVTEENNPYAEK